MLIRMLNLLLRVQRLLLILLDIKPSESDNEDEQDEELKKVVEKVKEKAKE